MAMTKEERVAYVKKGRVANREKVLASWNKYREANPEKVAACKKKNREANSEKVAAYQISTGLAIAANMKVLNDNMQCEINAAKVSMLARDKGYEFGML